MEDKATTTVTTLDHIDNITVPGEVFREPANEYWALVCLHHGMEFLYRQARRCDETVQQRLPPNGQFFSFGNCPLYDDIPKSLLTCSFHWYAISACNYVRTIGAIAYKLEPTRPLPQEYASNIIPEVVTFRDKFAAHFAWSTRNNSDNDAERLASVLPPLTFNGDSFYVGEMTVALRQGGSSSTSETIKPWSLCKVHETLRERYWPGQPDDSDSGEAHSEES